MDPYDLGYTAGHVFGMVLCVAIPLILIGGLVWFLVARSRRGGDVPSQQPGHQPLRSAQPPASPGGEPDIR